MNDTPPPTQGMHHLALNVIDLDACLHFYRDLIGMQEEWRPDEDNIYLCSGSDNLALHRVEKVIDRKNQSLDHLGFIMHLPEDVDRWHEHLTQNGVEMLCEVKQHRDGARSFYCKDPDGNVVQMIYHPPISHPA